MSKRGCSPKLKAERRRELSAIVAANRAATLEEIQLELERRTGCAWRQLPREFPPRQNVYRTFRRWSAQGKLEQMHDRLRAYSCLE
jgi:hypothetical protein